MKQFSASKSLEDLSDRQLLLFILSNQVNLFRQTKYIMNSLQGKENQPLGLYRNTFEELIKDADDILAQSERFLAEE